MPTTESKFFIQIFLRFIIPWSYWCLLAERWIMFFFSLLRLKYILELMWVIKIPYTSCALLWTLQWFYSNAFYYPQGMEGMDTAAEVETLMEDLVLKILDYMKMSHDTPDSDRTNPIYIRRIWNLSWKSDLECYDLTPWMLLKLQLVESIYLHSENLVHCEERKGFYRHYFCVKLYYYKDDIMLAFFLGVTFH